MLIARSMYVGKAVETADDLAVVSLAQTPEEHLLILFAAQTVQPRTLHDSGVPAWATANHGNFEELSSRCCCGKIVESGVDDRPAYVYRV
jgi:hypothetical protein